MAERRRSRRETIGTVVFELLLFGIDIFGIWPTSHVAALWVGAAGISIALYRHIPATGLALLLIATVFLISLVAQPQLPLNETEIHGWLTPANDPLPPDNACAHFSLPSPNSFFLLLGESGVYDADTAIKICGHAVLWVDYRDDKVFPDADIFDGRILAQIRNGEFFLNPNNYFRRERPDAHTLVVYDQMAKERLNIRFLNPHAIQITGIFTYPDCSHILTLTKTKLTLNGAPWFPEHLCIGKVGTALSVP